ncbi:hypothetical protein BDD12DRAFT_876216 [Trichophaea hybrida]|nr:hypothetical protein BDD12DRAFT_876216 [Trichophaea hybrida]
MAGDDVKETEKTTGILEVATEVSKEATGIPTSVTKLPEKDVGFGSTAERKALGGELDPFWYQLGLGHSGVLVDDEERISRFCDIVEPKELFIMIFPHLDEEFQPVFSTVPSVRDFSRTDGRRQGRPSPSFLKTDGMSAVINRHRAVTVFFRLNPIKPDNVIQASECMKSWVQRA